jgi:hypothetical protein
MNAHDLIPTPLGPRVVAASPLRGESRRLLLGRWRHEQALAVAPEASLTVRLATPSDRSAVEQLAELDSRLLPGGALLVAEVDGRIRALLPLAGGRPISDPFFPSASLVPLLRVRAAQLPANAVGRGAGLGLAPAGAGGLPAGC